MRRIRRGRASLLTLAPGLPWSPGGRRYRAWYSSKTSPNNHYSRATAIHSHSTRRFSYEHCTLSPASEKMIALRAAWPSPTIIFSLAGSIAALAVIFFVDFAEMGVRNVRINLGRIDGSVAEE